MTDLMPASNETAPMPAMLQRRCAKRIVFFSALAAALAAAGCSSPVNQAVAIAPVAEDFHLRHPVVLANAPQRLDVFFVGPTGRLDRPQALQLDAFAQDYERNAQSGIQIALPGPPADQAAAERTLGAVRRELLHLGIRGPVSVSSYPVRDPALASPLHLSFVTLQARPTTRCGQWPDDLGSGATVATWNNRSYYNLGCANQQTLAAQVADPQDLVKPRALDPTDVQLRTRAIGLLRGDPTANPGQDPSTTWQNNPPLIGPVGGF